MKLLIVDSNQPNSGLRNVAFIYRDMFNSHGISTNIINLRISRDLLYDEASLEYLYPIGSGFHFNLIYDWIRPYRNNEYDAVIYNTTKLKPASKRSYILIHDLFYNNVQDRILRIKHKMVLNFSKKKNIKFITVSDHVKSQLEKIGMKGYVIHPLPNYELMINEHKENVILMVGSQEPRKNIQFMNKFVKSIRSSDFKFIKVGGGLEIGENRTNVSNEDLNKLYSRAKVLLFPSIDEGFGLPVLEALMHGCIVISNDIPTSREIDMGSNIIDFIEVDKFDFDRTEEYLKEILGRPRDFRKWFELYKTRSNKEVELFFDDLVRTINS